MSDLSISIIGLIFLYISIREKLWSYYLNKLILILIIFYLYIIFLSIFSVDQIYSLRYSLFYFRYILFVLGVLYLINNDPRFLKKTTYFFIGTFIFIVVDGYIQFFFGYNLIGIPYNNYRVSSFFNDELIMGSYLARLMPFCFALVAMNKNTTNFQMLCFLFFLILTDVLIYLSGERTAFFLLFLSTFIIIICISKFKLFRFVSFLFSIFLIILITLNFSNVKERMIDRSVNQMALGQNDTHLFSTQHEKFFQNSFELFYIKPLTGHGPGMYRYLCGKHKGDQECSTHPHNNYFQILAEMGLIGIIPFILFFLILSYKLFLQLFSLINKSEKKYLSDAKVCIYAALIVSLWPLIPSMNFFNNWINILYYIPLAFYLADEKKLLVVFRKKM